MRGKYGSLLVDSFLEVLQKPEQQLNSRIEKLADGTYRLTLTGWDDMTVTRFRMSEAMLYIFWISWVKFEGELADWRLPQDGTAAPQREQET